MPALTIAADPVGRTRVQLSVALLFACLLPALIAIAVLSPADPAATAETYGHMD